MGFEFGFKEGKKIRVVDAWWYWVPKKGSRAAEGSASHGAEAGGGHSEVDGGGRSVGAGGADSVSVESLDFRLCFVELYVQMCTYKV